MSTKPLFRRHYFISLAVIAIGLVSSFFLAGFLLSLQRDRDRVRDHVFHSPAFMFRRLILATPLDPAKAIEAMDASLPQDEMFHLEYLGDDSPRLRDLTAAQRHLMMTNEPVVFGSERGGPPNEVILSLTPRSGALLVQSRFHGRAGLPPPPDFGGPGDHGPSPGGPRGPGGPPMGPPSFLWFTMACLFFSVIVTTGIAIKMLFASYKKRASSAELVLSQLKAGNLAARMPVEKMDELSELVSSFNHMADEIETLVTRLRRTEATRMEMLQSLAHDLRTPIASMKTFLESLREHGDRLTLDQRNKALDLCLAESGYFERLVEDLLVLASVGEPKFSPTADQVSLPELLEVLTQTLTSRHPRIKLRAHYATQPGPKFAGDQPLIERLLRNGLENALSFAKESVDVFVEWDGRVHTVRIVDDGPGLDAQAMSEFGQKRKSRKILRQDQTRVSSGIGSVIMTQIATVHGGGIAIANRTADDRILGAELTIKLHA